VCDSCGGLWVDWFDGELRDITAETLRTGDVPSDAHGGDKGETGDTERASKRNEAVAVGACPRCTRQLVPERYAMSVDVPNSRIDGGMSNVTAPTGAELLRCEDCMGAFVSRSSAEVLAWLSSPSDDPPPSQAAAALKPMPWTHFMSMLRKFLGITS
jgi:hypothetical protein